MKFNVGDKVRMIGNDISCDGLKRGMDGTVKRTDSPPWKDWPYQVTWACGDIWVKEHQIKRIKS